MSDARSTHSDPGARFPLELEERMMLDAAQQSREAALALTVVCHRARLWAEPILYESVTLPSQIACDQFLYTVNCRPASFFAQHVKTLCISGGLSFNDAQKILNVCQGVVNLACWPMTDPPLFSFIVNLRPQRLSINTSGLSGHNVPPKFRHPFWQNVTHLEIVDWLWCIWRGLEDIPHLSHLAVDMDYPHEGAVSRLRYVLDRCVHLQVIVCFAPTDAAMPGIQRVLGTIGDHRIVVLSDHDSRDPYHKWNQSLMEGEEWTYKSYWLLAKSIIDDRIALTSSYSF